jgi:hypothetical protein
MRARAAGVGQGGLPLSFIPSGARIRLATNASHDRPPLARSSARPNSAIPKFE